MEKTEIKKPVRWTEKFFKIEKIGEEPPLNREGFWKKYEPTKIEIKEEDG